MRNFRIGSGLVLVLVIFVLAGIACTNYTIPGKESAGNGNGNGNGNGTEHSCEECHTDYDRLMEVYTPDSVTVDTVYGVAVPHYESYERVYMSGEGFDAFKASGHYPLGCTGCHHGDSKSIDKDSAHSGDFIKHPSLLYEEKCGTCHKEITDNFTTSIHQGTGQKRSVAMRSGLNGPDEFDQLPAHQIEGYNNNCASCHGTCGNCHVVRPAMGGGGLAAGHNFNKTPDNDVCMTCHTTKGDAPGTQPDLHVEKRDFKCLSCHDELELHGNGQVVEQRYAYEELPKCEDCHEGIEAKNDYHSQHFDTFNCHVCHSQDYNNCGSCHINGEGTRIPSYLGFKIATNPLPDIKLGYDFALVRRTPAAPDNWKEYGVEAYSSFEALPTYNYATPHNLLRWTERTQVESGFCGNNCHIRKVGDSLINKELYLFQADLLEWELEATGPLTVDGKLPSYWPN